MSEFEIIDKKIVLSEDTAIETKKLNFRTGGQIVTNGFELRIRAKKIILDSVTPGQKQHSIISFESRQMNEGEDGRDADDIFIIADEVEGSRLLIKNYGEDGAKGTKGEKGSKGKKGRDGQGRVHKDLRGCVGRSAGNGGKGGTGKQGLPGGDGGDGGDVILFVRKGDENIKIESVNPGRGGDGGDGGNGGDGGDGGKKGRGRGGCGSVSAGRRGRVGDQGLIGIRGEDGIKGDIHNMLSVGVSDVIGDIRNLRAQQ